MATLNDFPAPSMTVASVRFVTGSKGMNFSGLNLFSAFWSFSALITAVSIASRSSILEASAAARMQSCGSFPSNRIGSARVSWFLVSVPVLSEHRISTPAISSIADSRETIAFSFESSRAPRAIVIENTAGIATGIEAISRIKTNCRMLRSVGDAPCVGNDDVAIDVDGDHGESEDEGDDDQEITDVEHRPLRMAHRAGAGDQLCGPAEEGVAAGADDDPFHLALLDDAARIGLVADLFRDRQGFAGQCRLVDRREIATGEAKIRGNDHAQADLDDVTRHQCRRVNGLPIFRPATRSLLAQGPFSRLPRHSMP